MRRAEPRWDRDFEYGRQGELESEEVLEWIAWGNARVEFKRKRRMDLNLYVETHCDKGRRGLYEPSGISATKAEFWAYIFGDSRIAIWIPTELLRRTLDHCSVRAVEERDGSCPTKGRLVNVAAILSMARGS